SELGDDGAPQRGHRDQEAAAVWLRRPGGNVGHGTMRFTPGATDRWGRSAPLSVAGMTPRVEPHHVMSLRASRVPAPFSPRHARVVSCYFLPSSPHHAFP